MMSMSPIAMPERGRVLTIVDVPSGPSCVDVLWDRLDSALSGGAPIAVIPQPSSSSPFAMVDAMRESVRPDTPVDDATAVVVSTSGSTGRPRGVCLSASALTVFAAHTNALAGSTPTWVLALPPTSIGGLNVMVRARATGRHPIAVPSVGGAERFTDVGFAEAVSAAGELDRPIAVSLVPTQLPRLLESSIGRRALARCSLILVGGAALTPQAGRDCTDAGIAITTTYGMTETSGGCVFDGLPLPNVNVRVDDTDGRIFLAGPMLAQGYRDGVNDSFADGWLRTNDRGRWVDGRLQVLGRLDDVVMVNGVNVDLVAIEDRANDHPAIEAAIAVAVQEAGSVRVHLIYTGREQDLREIQDWIAATLASPAAPTELHRVDSFATTASGKTDRRSTAEQLGIQPFEDEL
jgi:O-succinylbenzoic acid--CoA ligase